MLKTLFGAAALAIALGASPASAQLLAGGGSLGGTVGGALGGAGGTFGGSGVGSIGGMIDRQPMHSDTAASTRNSSRTQKHVDPRRGKVSASNASSSQSNASNATLIGDRPLTGGGSASGSAEGGIDAQLVGTGAVRSAAGRTTDTARNAAGNMADRTRTAASGANDRARAAAGNLASRASNVGGDASGAAGATGSGALSSLSAAPSATGSLALAGSGAADSGAFPVRPGMPVTDAKGRAIGTVQSVRSTSRGAVQRVLVKVGRKTADLPAANFSGSGSALVSAMGKRDVKDAAE